MQWFIEILPVDSTLSLVFMSCTKRAPYSIKRDLYTNKRALYTNKRIVMKHRRVDWSHMYRSTCDLCTFHFHENRDGYTYLFYQKSPIFNHKREKRPRIERRVHISFMKRDAYLWVEWNLCLFFWVSLEHVPLMSGVIFTKRYVNMCKEARILLLSEMCLLMCSNEMSLLSEMRVFLLMCSREKRKETVFRF